MDLHKRYGTDKNLEENGVWVELGDGGEILVARTNNPAFSRFVRQRLKPYANQIPRKNLDREVQDRITLEGLAKYVLLDWKGIVIDGKTIKYSSEKALELLKKYPDFQEDVLDAAGSIETFRFVTEEEDRKNS